MPFPYGFRKPTISRDMGAYADPNYLASLAEFGEPVWVPESGAGVLVQSIPGTRFHDARGPYPLLSCLRWDALGEELERLSPPWVSLVAVADPLSNPEPATLQTTFPDLCRIYKDHYIADLRRGYRGPAAEGHRRNLRRAERRTEIERVDRPGEALSDWLTLYAALCRERSIVGLSAFSEQSFRAQFAIDGLRAYRTHQGGETVAMALWLIDGKRAYYHLGASSPEGYAASAMFGLFDRALTDLAGEGVERVLLGAGAGTYGNPHDGLSRFKSGWANESRPAYLLGKVFDRETYRRLSGPDDEAYFPAYRSPAKAAAIK